MEGVKVGEKEATDHDRGSTTVKHSGKMTVRTGLDTKEGLDRLFPLGNFYLSSSINLALMPTKQEKAVRREQSVFKCWFPQCGM